MSPNTNLVRIRIFTIYDLILSILPSGPFISGLPSSSSVVFLSFAGNLSQIRLIAVANASDCSLRLQEWGFTSVHRDLSWWWASYPPCMVVIAKLSVIQASALHVSYHNFFCRVQRHWPITTCPLHSVWFFCTRIQHRCSSQATLSRVGCPFLLGSASTDINSSFSFNCANASYSFCESVWNYFG